MLDTLQKIAQIENFMLTSSCAMDRAWDLILMDPSNFRSSTFTFARKTHLTALEDILLSSREGRHEGHDGRPEVGVRANAVGSLPKERIQAGEGLLCLCLLVSRRPQLYVKVLHPAKLRC